MGPSYPFTALVGQEPLKRALILNAVNPSISGVLARGERGTAKSTAVRALADVLPEQEHVVDCPYHCRPEIPDTMCDRCRQRYEAGDDLETTTRRMQVIDLPLNASVDRVAGSIDLSQAIDQGEPTFEPGILAEANRNILYVDEVNLLDDHIVDVLLDAAAMGENIVEREGVSFRHPSEFILVGTMNPEEGALRPQLLDRFDMVVDVEATDDVDERLEIAKRRERFDADPEAFRATFADKQGERRDQIRGARDRLDSVSVPTEVLEDASYQALRQRAHGLRADVAVNRVARTIAALDGNSTVTEAAVTEAQYFVFPHRVEGVPAMDFGEGVIAAEDDEDAEGEDESDDETDGDDSNDGSGGGMPITADEDSYPVDRTAIDPPRDQTRREKLARQTLSRVSVNSGRYVRSELQDSVDDIAIDATIRAAAPHQRVRESGDGIVIEPRDLRQKIRERTAESLIVFIVDASGSVMNGQQMMETKRGLLSLIEEAYRSRDRIAVVVFRGESAFTLVEPTGNHRGARAAVSRLTVGGNTPLADGLVEGYRLIERERRRDQDLYALTVLFSDGQSNIPYREDGDAKEDAFEAASLYETNDVPAVFVDTGHQIDTTPDEIWTARKAERMKRKRFERNLDFADTMGASYLPLIDLPRNSQLPTELLEGDQTA